MTTHPHSYGMVINGARIDGSNPFPVLNPSTGAVAGYAADCTVPELDLAVAAAKAAFAQWSTQSDATLQAACEGVTASIEKHAEELAVLVTKEQGKPLNGVGSRWELGGAAAWSGYTSSLSLPVETLQDNKDGRVELHRKPVGVVGSITPWNFPVMIAIWHVLPAIRTGNTVVIKPSPNTPLATVRLVEIMNEVLPPGVVNCVTSSDTRDNIGAAMSSHPDIAKIVFTGSCATGQKVMQSAASTMKRLTLEMGGNDAGIVLDNVEPGAIAEDLFWGAFLNNGQTCAALKRLYVHESVYDDVCTELVNVARNIPVGDGMDEGNLLGPVQNQMQFDVVSTLVEAGKKEGRVLLGGDPGEGLFYPPTIIADLGNDNELVAREQFGPVLPIVPFSEVTQAVAMANDCDNGLGGSVWSTDIELAKAIAIRMECGSVWINKHGMIQPNAPFGGVKKSGIGVEFAKEGLQAYTDIQVVFS